MPSLICDVEGSHLSAAAIIGHDGTVWAQSSTFPLPEEVTDILNDRTEPGSLAPTGLLPILGGTSTWLFKANQGLS